MGRCGGGELGCQGRGAQGLSQTLAPCASPRPASLAHPLPTPTVVSAHLLPLSPKPCLSLHLPLTSLSLPP